MAKDFTKDRGCSNNNLTKPCHNLLHCPKTSEEKGKASVEFVIKCNMDLKVYWKCNNQLLDSVVDAISYWRRKTNLF